MPRRAPPISQADETTKRLLFPRRSGRTAPMMTGSGSRLVPRALLVARARSHARTDAMRSTGARATAAAALALALASLVAGADAARASDPASPPPFVDRCDACAAAGYALHDAMLYQQAKLRARHGSDARLADVADARKATAAAVESACDTRGHWLRYGVKSIARADGGAPLVTLAGPGLDADAAPGISLPDDDASRLVTSEFLRARCVAEADRVSVDGLIRAFNATAPESRRARASSDPRVIDDVDLDDLSLTDDDDDDTHLPLDDARVAESSAAFAFALCVRGEWDTLPPAPAPRRGETAATKPAPAPCLVAATRAKARAVMDAARAAQEATFAFTRAAEETDENAEGEGSLGGSLGATTRACARDAPALVAELRRHARARASGSNSSGFDSDFDSFDARSFGRFGLSEEEEVSARACATASDAHFARGDAYARKAADAEMNGRGASAAAAADTNRRAALRAYAAGESTWPSSARSALAATRTARALVAENPNTRRRVDGRRVSDESSEDDSSEDDSSEDDSSEDDSSSSSFDKSPIGAALAAASRAVELDPHDPTSRLAAADLLFAAGDDASASDEYTFALYYLPFFGETAAAATTRAGAAASSLAHRLATHLVELSTRAEEAEMAGRQSAFDAATRAARESAVARARDAVENHLEALVMEPTRRRHVSVAASMLAHASLADPYGGDERWSNAIAAADVVEKCDDATPPEECRGVMVAHAKNMAEMELWSLSREAAYLALAAKGERGRATRAAWDVARAAEAKMDAATDEALMARVLGPKWRDIIRGAPENRAREGEL